LQAPLTQLSPLLHAVPHTPQLALSFFSLTQAPVHDVRPAGHWLRHAPPPQTCPLAHFIAHALQFAGSLLVLVQVPSQSVWPAGQTCVVSEMQTPARHSSLFAHALPQVPQFPGS
jgi:hypothetical protein